ncbi:MAG: hypothetical protein LBT69_02435 [Lactobacillales bacterium]|jgi:hypothetical protein|nr:hypothetical protein [Lactobacillales bacterium]
MYRKQLNRNVFLIWLFFMCTLHDLILSGVSSTTGMAVGIVSERQGVYREVKTE